MTRKTETRIILASGVCECVLFDYRFHLLKWIQGQKHKNKTLKDKENESKLFHFSPLSWDTRTTSNGMRPMQGHTPLDTN